MWLYFGASPDEAKLIELALEAEGRPTRVVVPAGVGAAFDLIRSARSTIGLLVAYVCSDESRLSDFQEFLLCQQSVQTFSVVALCSGERSLDIARQIGFRHRLDRGFAVDDLRSAVQRMLAIASGESGLQPARTNGPAPASSQSMIRCRAASRDGIRCGRLASPGSIFCWQHCSK